MDDRALLSAIARKDTRAFETFYHRYEMRLMRYLTGIVGDPLVAEDLVVEVMWTVWQNAHRFRNHASVSTWVMGIARNKAFDFLRRHKPTIVLDDSTLMEPYMPSLLDQIEVLEKVRLFTRAFLRLDPIHREVLELAFVEEMSYTEIAALIGCPVNTVKTRVYYARRYLRQHLRAMESRGARTDRAPRQM